MMKLLNKIESLKLFKKIMILISTLILVAIINYFYYNYQTIKLPNNERYYDISYTQDEKESNTLNLNIDLNNKYVKYLIFEYQTKLKENFLVIINNKSTGYLEGADYCYSYLHKGGFNLHKKIGAAELKFDPKNIEILRISVDNSYSFNWVSYSFWIIGISLILLIIMFKTIWLKKIHLLSFLLCISIGIVFLVCNHNMTSTTFDDETHFNRVNTFMVHSEADEKLEKRLIVFNYFKTPQEKAELQDYLNQVSNESTSDKDNYNLFRLGSINYLPMALTVKLANMIGCNYTTCFFLGKIVNLLIYSIVIMFAVKLMPCHKLLTLLIGILPQSLFLASNYSYDPTVTAFSILAFAAFAREYHDKTKKIEIKNVLIFILAGLYASLPKMVYSPILLLLLFLPKEKFKNNKQCLIFRLCICFLVLLCLASFALPATSPSAGGDPRGGDTSVSRQLNFIITNPLPFIKVFVKSGVLTMVANLIGPSTMGLLSHYGGLTIETGYYLILMALALAFISEKDFPDIKTSHRIIMLFLYFAISCFIYLSMYLSFTPVGSNTINGVQPRYFIPLLLPIFYCFSTKNLKNNLNYENTMVVSTTFFIIAIFMLTYFIIIIPYCL